MIPASRMDDQFRVFHRDNPWVLDTLIMLARRAKRAGMTKYGMNALFEVLRWERMVQTSGLAADDFKLNSHYTAPYARMIMAQCPDLAGFFETRVRRNERGP